MKIISLITQKLNGVTLYRSLLPHASILKYEPEHHVKFVDNLIMLKDEELAEHDILQMSYSMYDKFDVERAKRLGLKVVIDVDDYWMVDRFHELYDNFKENDRAKIVIEIIKQADAITTSTELLAEKIKLFKDVLSVLPNNLMEDNFVAPKVNPTPYLAWIGGSNHTSDMFEIQHLVKTLKFPVFIPEMYRIVFKDRFLYYPAQDIPDYLNLYNKFDIILAPLRKNKFNQYKSPLKLIEAGAFKKPIIVSNVEPFKCYLKHKENCLVVSKKSEWNKWSKLLSNDADMRKELGENLFKDTMREFNTEIITKKRIEFYKSILE
jgi:hypothetical protein